MQRRMSEMQGQNTQLEVAARQAGWVPSVKIRELIANYSNHRDIAEEARSTAEKLRNDAALLRAENELWKVQDLLNTKFEGTSLTECLSNSESRGASHGRK